MTEAIRADALVKTFGRTRALDGLDLAVQTGEVYGFLGPNGAGKTTTIRILLGLLRADAGAARLLGGDPWRDAADLHRRLAYVARSWVAGTWVPACYRSGPGTPRPPRPYAARSRWPGGCTAACSSAGSSGWR
jgi:ABC-type uncharacterized transport system ATPase subunit